MVAVQLNWPGLGLGFPVRENLCICYGDGEN